MGLHVGGLASHTSAITMKISLVWPDKRGEREGQKSQVAGCASRPQQTDDQSKAKHVSEPNQRRAVLPNQFPHLTPQV